MKSLVKVGIFASICLVVLAILIWKIEDLNPFGVKGQHLHAVFDSIAGLDDKASVRIAGVRVGQVDGVGLQGTKARVGLALDKPIPLTVGTTARIANLGLLGEKYVEIIPGPPGAPPLPPNSTLVGTTPPSIDDAMAKLSDIGSSIQKVTGALAGSDVAGGITRLMADIQLTSAEIRALVAENRANVGSSVRNIDALTATLARELPRLASQTQQALDQISELVRENRGNVSASLGNIRELTEKLQTSADNLNAISGKIASGKGTIGKLVNDEKAYNDVISTLDSIQGGVQNLSESLGGLNKFQIGLDLHGYYRAKTSDSQQSLSAFQMDIDPQDSKHLYRVGVTNSPFGRHREKTQTYIVTGPSGQPETTTITTQTEEQTYAFTGLFGYKGPESVRLYAGLIEGAGGAQIEYPLPILDRRLQLSFEAFDFNRPNDQRAHLRLLGRYQFAPNLYLLGGYDDILEHHSLFIGGGIRWTDENIRKLFGLAGAAIR
ncbi:MAG TPA: MlaD family protein [Thermoanaerobaculia bacterium]|nr:MlaD family protein [Thermoanaerobaculia bacterium]